MRNKDFDDKPVATLSLFSCSVLEVVLRNRHLLHNSGGGIRPPCVALGEAFGPPRQGHHPQLRREPIGWTCVTCGVVSCGPSWSFLVRPHPKEAG
jgi:hypothetical protein